MTINPKALCQIEIRIGDLAKALRFYEHVFAWKPVPAEVHNYVIIDVPDDCPFGITLVPDAKTDGASDRIVLFFGVDDPETIADLAGRWGGAWVGGPKKLSAYGTVYLVSDPDGQQFGLFKKGPKPTPERAT